MGACHFFKHHAHFSFFLQKKKYNFSTNIQEIEYYKSHLYNHGRSFIETQERVKQAAIAPVRPQKSATTSALIDLHEKMWTHLSGEELLNILVGQIIMSYCLTHFFPDTTQIMISTVWKRALRKKMSVFYLFRFYLPSTINFFLMFFPHFLCSFFSFLCYLSLFGWFNQQASLDPRSLPGWLKTKNIYQVEYWNMVHTKKRF